jgi:hypothetical protein
MISETDRAYAAGFFDGEGTIFIEKPRAQRGYALIVAIGQRDSEPLKWLQARWGGSIKPHSASMRAYRWCCIGSSAGRFLTDIAPYLKCKREAARLALELQATKSHALRATPEYLRWCEEIRQSIKNLNAAT